MYVDKRVGGYSYKVLGWQNKSEEYLIYEAASRIEALGYSVKVHRTADGTGLYGAGGNNLRIIVKKK